MIDVNQQAPDFSLPDSRGNTVSLSSFLNKKNIVIIIYPGDDTPTCTLQLTSVRDNYEDFEKLDSLVLGINPQNAESHNAFIQKFGLKNPLLVDENKEVIEKYGALAEDSSAIRSVIIIDKQGIIRYIQRGKPEHQEIKQQLEQINQ
jgi:thioredoxin-dependent peroxiredoxin